MSRQLTPATTLENLKKEAKRWLKALRAGSSPARARLQRAFPGAPAPPGLRDVQHALALEHGYRSWTALKNALAELAPAGRLHAERVAWFLEHACNDHRVMSGSAHAMHQRAAARLLNRHPEIARDSLYTAVVCGDLEEVERLLAERPEAASEPGGPKGWPPLLYLCFGRAPLAAAGDNAVAIASALLDRGADPNAFFDAPCPYSALVGVIGEGEEDAPAHPQAEALARLLLERGAEPYDIQLLYNTHFHGRVRWLELVYDQAVKLSRRSDWDDPDWSVLDFGGYGSGARFLLGAAVTRNQLERAEWLLARGANPNAALPPHSKLPQRSLHEEALRRGFTEMAELLLRYGAIPSAFVLDAEEAFQAACLRLDREQAQACLERNPELRRSPAALFAAARQDRADAAALLLDLGVSPDVQDPQGTRPLHVAAGHDALRVAALLIERGAEVDFRESNWGATPLGIAVYENKPRMIALLSRVSRDVFNLAFTGNVERLREVLGAEPERARAVNSSGVTPLMRLPDDEARAVEIVELLLACGADPAVRNQQGLTAAECARKRGMEEVAGLLRTVVRGAPALPVEGPGPPGSAAPRKKGR